MPVNYVLQEKHHSSMVVETPLQQTCKKNTQEQAMISAGLTKRSSKAAETLILRVHMRTINCRPLERNTLFLTFLIGINIYVMVDMCSSKIQGSEHECQIFVWLVVRRYLIQISFLPAREMTAKFQATMFLLKKDEKRALRWWQICFDQIGMLYFLTPYAYGMLILFAVGYINWRGWILDILVF